MPRSRSTRRLVDVAERAGVSLATASRALSGREGVSTTVAENVREVAREIGYVANLHARTLAGGSTSIVGLIVHEIDDPYFSEIAAGVVRVAGDDDLMVQICQSSRDPDNELRQIRSLIASRVGAIIVSGSGYVDPELQAESRIELERFEEAGGRVAVIGRHHLRADAVLPDNRGSGTSLAEHVLSLGHTAIAIASGPVHLTTVADRLEGIGIALERAGSSLASTPVVETDFTRDGGHAAAAQILDEHPGTTAVIALNDAMAIGVLSTLRSRSIAVPDQISVAGFDDVAVAADLAPGLTTVRLPMAEMGASALRLAQKSPVSRPRRKATGHTLVPRDSTGPASDR